MPPKLVVPDSEPTPLIPDADEDSIAGISVVPARALTRDAFNVMWYAYPGVGKTTVGGMFAGYPPACDVLIGDAEGGASVLSHLDHVDIAAIRTWRDADKLLTYFERARLEDLKYRTLGFDNITELHAMAVKQIAGSGELQIQHHNVLLGMLMSFTRRLRDLSRFRGINTFLMGWQESKRDDTRGITRQVVALTDKLSARLPGIPNNVGYITVMNNPPLNTRRMSFAATPLNDAKFRRSGDDEASTIPDDIYYSREQNPIADMLRTIYEGVPFPADQYARPKGRKANVNTTDDKTEIKE